jgi:hypothetical protein
MATRKKGKTGAKPRDDEGPGPYAKKKKSKSAKKGK